MLVRLEFKEIILYCANPFATFNPIPVEFFKLKFHIFLDLHFNFFCLVPHLIPRNNSNMHHFELLFVRYSSQGTIVTQRNHMTIKLELAQYRKVVTFAQGRIGILLIRGFLPWSSLEFWKLLLLHPCRGKEPILVLIMLPKAPRALVNFYIMINAFRNSVWLFDECWHPKYMDCFVKMSPHATKRYHVSFGEILIDTDWGHKVPQN